MTKKQQEQFNKMALTLRRIHHAYMTSEKIFKESKGKNSIGLSYTEYLEMAYDNIQQEARAAVNGVKLIGYL